MKNSKTSLIACALLLSLIATPAAFACVNVTTETVAETASGGVVDSDCWYGGPGNGMRIYHKLATITNINLYQITQNYCTGYTERQFVMTVYSYTSSTCWQLTSQSCVGPQDWYPSPRC